MFRVCMYVGDRLAFIKAFASALLFSCLAYACVSEFHPYAYRLFVDM